MPTTVLIEDDVRIARLLDLELRRAGWEVIRYNRGLEAIDATRTIACDVVILDLMLPDIDGIKVCAALRAESRAPILILSARNAVHDRVAGLDAGADDYLVKPFATSELMARMRAIMRRRAIGEGPDDWIAVGNIRLSPSRHEVRVDEALVELTRREFALMQYFLENQGIAVTRNMILEQVWGWGYNGTVSIVDVYVGYLRTKIAVASSKVYLATIRGVGYALKLQRE